MQKALEEFTEGMAAKARSHAAVALGAGFLNYTLVAFLPAMAASARILARRAAFASTSLRACRVALGFASFRSSSSFLRFSSASFFFSSSFLRFSSASFFFSSASFFFSSASFFFSSASFFFFSSASFFFFASLLAYSAFLSCSSLLSQVS